MYQRPSIRGLKGFGKAAKTATILTAILVSVSFLVGLTAVAADEKIVLTMYGYSNDPQKATLEKYIAEYMKLHPDIEIKNLGAEYSTEKLLSLLIAGEAPDIFQEGNNQIVALYREGVLDPVPQEIANKLMNRVFPITLEGLVFEGKLYGVPNENMPVGLFYNKRVLAENGMAEPPATLDELTLMAKRLTKLNSDGSVKTPGIFEWDPDWHWDFVAWAMLRAEGGSVLDEEGNVTLDAPPVYRVLERVGGWLGAQGERPVMQLGWPSPFFRGDVAFSFGYPWYINVLRPNYEGDFVEDIGVIPVPAGQAGPGSVQYSHGFVVNRDSKYKDEAWKFLDWLAHAEVDEASPIGYLSAAIGSLPMAADDIAAYEDERPIYEDFLACLDYARSHAYLIKRGVTMSKLGAAVKAVADGESPAQAVQDAVRKIEEDIRKFNERTK